MSKNITDRGDPPREGAPRRSTTEICRRLSVAQRNRGQRGKVSLAPVSLLEKETTREDA